MLVCKISKPWNQWAEAPLLMQYFHTMLKTYWWLSFVFALWSYCFLFERFPISILNYIHKFNNCIISYIIEKLLPRINSLWTSIFYSDQKSADNEIWSQYNQLLYCLKTFKHCRFHCIRIPSGKILFELLSIINTNYICCFYLEVIINMACR